MRASRRAGRVVAAGEGDGHELGDARVDHRLDPVGDRGGVADERHVLRPGRTLTVEHRAVGGQDAIDLEGLRSTRLRAGDIVGHRYRQRGDDALVGAACGRPQRRDGVLGKRLGAGHPGRRAVRELCGEAEHPLAQRRHDQPRRGDVGDVELEVGGESFGVGVGLLAAQQRAERREVLLHVRRRTIERVAVHVLDHHLVREPDAQRQTALARRLHGECLLGERGGVAGVDGHHRGAELDVGDEGAHDGQGGQGVEAEDLRKPVGGEAVVGCGLGVLDGSGDRRAWAAQVSGEDSDAHGVPPVVE